MEIKVGRNDLCWCGSGKKYKSCHLAFDEKIAEYKKKGVLVPTRKMIKTPEQIEGIRKASILNTMVLDEVEKNIKEGMSTEEINTIVHEFTVSHGGIPATLGYCGYPKSVCTSVNDEICHGIPSPDVILKDGDIVNVDCTTILNGYFGDASRMFMIGNVAPKTRQLVEVTKKALDLGFEAVKPWGRLGDVGAAINNYAKQFGFTVVREIGGHGVGLEMHEDPYVCHVGVEGTGLLLVPGMVFTIEPMINMGTEDLYQDADNGWTIYTDDGLPSAQFEYTVLVTDDGAEILTK